MPTQNAYMTTTLSKAIKHLHAWGGQNKTRGPNKLTDGAVHLIH